VRGKLEPGSGGELAPDFDCRFGGEVKVTDDVWVRFVVAVVG